MLLVDTVTGTLFFLSLLISQPLSLNCSQSVLVSLQDQALQPTHSQLFMCYLFIFFLQTYLHLHKSTGLTWTSSNLYRQVFGLIFCFFWRALVCCFFCLFFYSTNKYDGIVGEMLKIIVTRVLKNMLMRTLIRNPDQ